MEASARRLQLLVVVAHPDDETFGLGSVLAHAAANGIEARVICATRGELGEPAIDIGSTPLGEVREGELRAACERVVAKLGDQAASYRAGKKGLLGFFVGQVMKATEGKANPALVNDLLRKKLR